MRVKIIIITFPTENRKRRSLAIHEGHIFSSQGLFLTLYKEYANLCKVLCPGLDCLLHTPARCLGNLLCGWHCEVPQQYHLQGKVTTMY